MRGLRQGSKARDNLRKSVLIAYFLNKTFINTNRTTVAAVVFLFAFSWLFAEYCRLEIFVKYEQMFDFCKKPC